MKLTDYFGAIYLLNLRRRPDRLLESVKEFRENGIENYTIVEAYDHPTSGHIGCTRSHRMLLRQIADGPHDRVLILEDDFAAVTRARLIFAGFTDPRNPVWQCHCSILDGHGDLNQRFNCLSPWLPEKWDCLFLGCSYAESPVSRLNKHVVRSAGIKGTGSVGVIKSFARAFTEKADSETGGSLDNDIGPIDNYYSTFSREKLFYVLQPRLIFQRASKSDIDGGCNSRLFDHTDSRHESMV